MAAGAATRQEGLGNWLRNRHINAELRKAKSTRSLGHELGSRVEVLAELFGESVYEPRMPVTEDGAELSGSQVQNAAAFDVDQP